MRQRLALAAALLGDPELLFLDEPLDGLDPAGQAQIKASLRQLAADGRTIVVSSHNLGDVEAMADEVVVINRGKLVTQSSLDEILGVQMAAYHVEVADPLRAVQVLVAAGIAASTTDGRVLAEADNGSDVSRILAAAELYPSALYKRSGRLEEVFLRLTGEQQ
jgi:ABC-2 type transport system ATP-binding protein